MSWKKLNDSVRLVSQRLQVFIDRFWYAPLLGLLAALDNFVVIVPTDGLVVSSSMLLPKRWYVYGFCVAVGSSVGAMTLAHLVRAHGLPWALQYFPGVEQTGLWRETLHFFEMYGLILVFLIAATPLMQQPAIILASASQSPMDQMAVAVFSGRLLKFLFMAYIGSHAPKLLSRLWGIQSDLKDVGVPVKPD